MATFPGRFLLIWVIAAGWGAPARAQEAENAEALLARAYETLTGSPHLEITATTRSLTAIGVDRPGGEGGRVMGAAYQELRVTWRQPDDWRLVSQREREARGHTIPERKLVFGKVGEGDGAVLLLNLTTKEPVRAPVPAGLFRQEIIERAGTAVRDDLLLNALLFNRAEVGARAFGLEEVSRAGPDEVGGARLTRLSATMAGGGRSRVTVWVDESSGLITRSLVVPLGVMPMGMTRRFTETLYTYDFIRGADTADFDLEEGWSSARPGFAASAGFAPMAEVFALTGVPGQGGPSAPRPPTEERPELRGFAPTPAPPPAPKTTPTPASPKPGAVAARGADPVVEEQLLTPAQMEAIVLVEGDSGVGSGFIARIREVDFVVTNLHVIGGNEKVRVTTVRGAPIKVGGMFGAVGRDIALLRIEDGGKLSALPIAEDPLKTAKLGDKVAVVGNRRGGGVATQVSGVVRGIGPDKVEVDAPFQPGNSGSPIVHVATGEVLGLATYSQTRRLDLLDGPANAGGGAGAGVKAEETKTEQRWFGYRADSVAKWEAIDLAKWREQANRIAAFEADSEAIYHAMNGRFGEASANPRVRLLIDRLEERYQRMGASQTVVMQEVNEFFRGLRALAETGTKDLKTGDYYDFFRSSLYWETSIPEQLRAREDLARRLDRASENTTAFLVKLRR